VQVAARRLGLTAEQFRETADSPSINGESAVSRNCFQCLRSRGRRLIARRHARALQTCSHGYRQTSLSRQNQGLLLLAADEAHAARWLSRSRARQERT